MKKVLCLVLTIIMSFNILTVYAENSINVYFEYHRPLTPSLDYTSYKAVDSSLKPQSVHILDFTPGKETLPLVSFGKSMKSHKTVLSMLKSAREEGFNAVAGVNGDFYSFYTGIPLSAVISGGFVLSSNAGNNAIGFYPDGKTVIGNPNIMLYLSFVPSADEVSADTPSEDNLPETAPDTDVTTPSEEAVTVDIPSETLDVELSGEITSAIRSSIPTDIPSVTPSDTPTDSPSDTEDPSLDIPEDTTDVTVEENTVTFDAYFNKYPTVYAAYMTDSHYSSSTASSFPCTEYVLIPSSPVKIGEKSTLTVEKIFKGEGNTPISEDRFVLTIPDAINMNGEFSGIKEGTVFELEVTASEGWSGVETAIGGGDIIVSDGAFIPECVDESHERLKNARTAVGVREDGSVFFAIVDGDGESGAGMNYEALAEFMISNGAVTVVNLDGGGSTTVAVAFSGDDEIKVMNTPKDGAARSVSNAVLFVNISEDSQTLGFCEIDIPAAYLLGGATLALEPIFYTAFGREMIFDTQSGNIENSYIVSDTDAKVDGGYYVSADKSYTERLFGVHKIGDISLESVSVINVVDSLDSLDLSIKKLVVSEGDVFRISAIGEKNGISVITPLSMLDFFVKADAAEDQPLENEEPPLEEKEPVVSENTEKSPGDETQESTEEPHTDSYLFENDFITLSDNGILTVKSSAPLFSSFDLTVAYKGIEDILTLYFGKTLETLDDFEYDIYSGKFVDASNIIRRKGYRSNTALQSLNGNISYKESMKLDVCPESFMIYIRDNSQDGLYCVISHNGNTELLPYGIYKDYSDISGWVTLIAPISDGIEGEIEVLCPIISKTSSDFTVDGFTANYGFRSDPFEDIEGIWSHDYIVEIFDMGLINGYVEDDSIIFKPENNITRAEFAKMLASFLALDMSKYSTYGTDFADAESIAEWASSYIMALSNEGYMNGRSNPDGTLTFDSNSFITREEAMHVFAKLLEISEEASELEFADSEKIQEWALESVKKVVSAGIVTGFDDGTIRAGDPVTRAQMCTMFTRLWNIRYAK